MAEKTLPFTKAQIEGIIRACPTPFHLYDEEGIRGNARRRDPVFGAQGAVDG